MCGICGLVDFRNHFDVEKTIGNMLHVQHHRGPDSAGCLINGRIALGHNRLKIIDLSENGSQPMSNETRTLWLVFNGEIYNYKELRETLLSQGHVFKSQTDSEVLLHLYEEDGQDLVNQLNGIFAFAIFDINAQTLFLTRDHFGIKPLYFSADSKRFMFASEIKALIAAGVDRELDEAVFQETLIMSSCAGSGTLLKDVRRLLPGESLLINVRSGSYQQQRFWVPTIHDETTPADAVERVHELLSDAVQRQLVADVPVGTMCSGGLDSSLLSAMSHRITSNSLDTYVIDVPHPKLTETKYAGIVSSHIQSNHHVLKTDVSHASSLLPLCLWLHDEPLAHSNSLSIFQIAQLAKQQVTVLLSGEGADEVFGGYHSQKAIPTLATLQKLIPGSFARLLDPFFWRLNSGGRIARALQRVGAHDLKDCFISRANAVSPVLLKHLGFPTGSFLEYRREILGPVLKSTNNLSLAMMLYEQQTYLQTLLDRQDKMTMGASIESRVPFLDIQLVEAANNMGIALRYSEGKDKWVLRKIAQEYLPSKIVDRPKHGFGMPLSDWLRQSTLLTNRIDSLEKSPLLENGFIPRKTIQKILKMWYSGNDNLEGLMWNIVNLGIWWDIFIDNHLPENTNILPSYANKFSLKTIRIET